MTRGKQTQVVRVVALAILVVVLVAILAVAVGCGEDAPVGQRQSAPRDVINMPDGWSNVAQACDGHGHRVFVSDHGDSYGSTVAVIADASCPGGTEDTGR